MMGEFLFHLLTKPLISREKSKKERREHIMPLQFEIKDRAPEKRQNHFQGNKFSKLNFYTMTLLVLFAFGLTAHHSPKWTDKGKRSAKQKAKSVTDRGKRSAKQKAKSVTGGDGQSAKQNTKKTTDKNKASAVRRL
jgi:hypothetical protein